MKWISIEDKLPENDGLYITCNTTDKLSDFGEPKPSYYIKKSITKWQTINKVNMPYNTVTHWMKFPNKPKEPK